ncbi:hypothetical protein HK18_02730 [Commensalibacter intestini]|uniref:Uncharacterized protein n=1 Tax=Commensalibacter intestini TaxID=479936 RepID=A0A251ZXU6_9PROT|nr:hypothetical protein [Commensalibacter intestini]OUI79487.1 hypothetical protein HK18_02730 [Commensalibacter intestini]
MKLYKFASIFTLTFCSITNISYAQDTPLPSLAIRSLQTREFTELNKDQAIAVGLATFQDLGFIITETSAPLGFIKANQTRPDDNMIIQATLTLIPDPTENNTITARLSLSTAPFYTGEEGANLAGQLPRQSTMLKTPKLYQQFFQAFSNAIQLNKAL